MTDPAPSWLLLITRRAYAVVRRWVRAQSASLQATGELEPRPLRRRRASEPSWDDDAGGATPAPEAQPAGHGWTAEAPPERALTPSAFEQRFTRLGQRRDFPGMWDLIAEDAQRAWGGRDRFVESMWRERAAGWEVVEVRVLGVSVLGEWRDERRGRDHRGVAQLHCRYRLRHRGPSAGDGAEHREVDRDVHLVPAVGGWRTLFYPPG
jgi:hypothetical protein